MSETAESRRKEIIEAARAWVRARKDAEDASASLNKALAADTQKSDLEVRARINLCELTSHSAVIDVGNRDVVVVRSSYATIETLITEEP